MILYHGTTEKIGKEILRSGVIKKNISRRYLDNSGVATTDGYVYMTNDFTYAVYYGNKNAVLDKENNLIIFKVEINDNLLEPDKDEIEYTLKVFGKVEGFEDINNPTLEESLKNTKAARVPMDIELDKYAAEYAVIESSIGPTDNSSKTLDLVRIMNSDNDYANSFKNDFFNKVNWETCK